MTATDTRMYRLGESHAFDSAGHRFAYLPSGAIFEIDEIAGSVVDRLRQSDADHAELIDRLTSSGLLVGDAEELLQELRQARAVVAPDAPADIMNDDPPTDFPLQSLVLNLTNQCNLSCTYCYEFGEDKVATPEGKPKFMELETAKRSVEMLLEESHGRPGIHITFFGGETLMNFPLLKNVVEYANMRTTEQGRTVDYSLTTNATLLTPEIVQFLSDHRIGVTVSMDGPADLHDKFRVYSNGKGSYDLVAAKAKMLIAGHKTRPIVARVTLTNGVTDVIRIYRHLRDDLGFHEVGFAPVTTSPDRLYAIGEPSMDGVLEQFKKLSTEWMDFALRGEMHGFTNVSDTIAELIQGVNKSLPCGAALGLVGVGPSGDIAPCHRFVDSDEHAMGNVTTGIDRSKQSAFLERGHIKGKYDCHTCFARPLCAGGCHHEAFVRYGDTGHANLHFCDWIRDWTDTCLHIYGTLAAENPGFLLQFAQRKAT